MAGKVRTWVWVVVALVAFAIVSLAAVVGGAFFYVSRHVQTRTVTPVAAMAEFDGVRAEFKDSRPLIELDREGRFLRTNTARKGPAPKRIPNRLHLLAFDPSDGRIVRFSLPFWLLRMKTTIDLNGSRMDLEDLRLSVEELERHGAALIVDHKGPDGTRVLVWSN